MRPSDYDKYTSLPGWALDTLDKHRGDRRRFVYTRRQFEHADTHDPLWNAAQRAYGMRKRPTPDKLRKIGEAWRPYRSVAAWYLWQSLAK